VRVLDRGLRLDLRGVDLVVADLAGALDVPALVDGAETIVLTANAVAPRKGDDAAAFAAGARALIEGSVACGVRRVVLPSVPVTGLDSSVPLAAERRRLEELVGRAVPASVILRLPPFMEVWLALVGSSIPLRGELAATIARPSPFLRSFRSGTATLVERRGVMLVPGPAQNRHAFISVADAAAACAEAVSRPDLAGQVREVAGPEVLSWRDVADIYSRLLGRRVRILSTPAAVYAAAAYVLGPFAAVPSRTMALNRFMAGSETAWQPPGGGLVDAARMTTVEEFLTAKLALPDRLAG
jgi:NADH dehydrogenase